MTNDEALQRLEAQTQILEQEQKQLEYTAFATLVELRMIHKILSKNKEAKNEKR